MNDERLGIVRLSLPDGRTVALSLTFSALDARGHDWFIEQLKLMQKGRGASSSARADLLEALSNGAVLADEVRGAAVSDYPLTATMKAIWAAWELAQYGPAGRVGEDAPENPPMARPTLWKRVFGRR